MKYLGQVVGGNSGNKEDYPRIFYLRRSQIYLRGRLGEKVSCIVPKKKEKDESIASNRFHMKREILNPQKEEDKGGYILKAFESFWKDTLI